MMTSFTWKQVPALSVHVFTSTGILAGFMAILAINNQDWRTAITWLFVCQIIDGVDGTFARMFKVKEVLPSMDGTTIDQVIDFATYAIIPAYFLYQSGIVPAGWSLPCAFAMLLAAALYYGKQGMISPDMHFIGFPVMWNVVVFFLFFVFGFSPAVNAGVIFFFAIMHFVPLRYPYPSRAQYLQGLTLAISALALADAALIVWIYPERNDWLSYGAMASMAYYAFLTWKGSFQNRR